MTDGDVDRALRLVTSLPEPVYLRIGYEPWVWSERALDLASPEHPLFPAAVGFAARAVARARASLRRYSRVSTPESR